MFLGILEIIDLLLSTRIKPQNME